MDRAWARHLVYCCVAAELLLLGAMPPGVLQLPRLQRSWAHTASHRLQATASLPVAEQSRKGGMSCCPRCVHRTARWWCGEVSMKMTVDSANALFRQFASIRVWSGSALLHPVLKIYCACHDCSRLLLTSVSSTNVFLLEFGVSACG